MKAWCFFVFFIMAIVLPLLDAVIKTERFYQEATIIYICPYKPCMILEMTKTKNKQELCTTTLQSINLYKLRTGQKVIFSFEKRIFSGIKKSETIWTM